MPQEDTFVAVTGIIREELQADHLALTPQTSLQEIEGWDSVTSSCVIIAIENQFGVEFDGGLLEHLTTVQSLVDAVEKHPNAQS